MARWSVRPRRSGDSYAEIASENLKNCKWLRRRDGNVIRESGNVLTSTFGFVSCSGERDVRVFQRD